MKFIKYTIGSIVGLITITLLTVVIVVNFVDPNVFKNMIEEKVATETGRELSIDGNIEWGFWPKLRLHTGAIQLSNAPGFGDKPFLKLDKLEFAVETQPLFSRSIKIDTVKLYGAEINLAKNSEGLTNWDDFTKKSDDQDDEAESSTTSSQTRIAIGGVDIQNAAFSFRDDTAQQAFEFSNIQLTTGPLELGDPVDLKISLEIKSSKPNIEGNAKLAARIIYDLDNQHYIIEPIIFASNLKGPKIPGGTTQIKLSGLVDANMGENKVEIKKLNFTGLDMNLKGELALFDLDYDKPGARGTITLDGKDIAILFEVLESPISQQLARTKDRTFHFDTRFNANMQTGNVSVPKFNANLLGAKISGQFIANNTNTEQPTIAGKMGASGPDLPALIALVGQLQRNNDIRDIGQKLSKAPAKDFSFNSAFKADLKSGQVIVPTLKGSGLGLTLNATLKANNINAENAPIAGKLSLTGKGLKPLLAAVGQEDLSDILKSFSVATQLSGTIENISLKPLTISTIFAGKDIPNSPAELKFEVNAANANLDAEIVTIENFSLNGLGLNIIGNLNASKIKSSPLVDGNLGIKPFNLRHFMTQLKQKIPPMADSKTLTKFGLDTNFSGSTNSIAMKNIAVVLDQTTLNGSLAVTDIAKQDLTFNLNLDRIDADRYLPPATEEPKDKNKKQVPKKAPIETSEKLPVALLQDLKISGSLNVGEIKIAGASAQKIIVSVRARDGNIQVNPIKAHLYQGQYEGAVMMTAKDETLTVKFNSNLSGIKLRPLLQDIADSDKLGGTANIDIALTGSGQTSEAIKQSLDGIIKFELSKGTIHGLTAFSQFGQRMGGIDSLLSGDFVSAVESASTHNEPTETLYFSGLSATIMAADGVFTNDDLKLEAPLLRASGVGTIIDLNTNTIDYTTEVTFVTTLEGSGGKSLQDLTGLPVPMLKQLKGIPISIRQHGPINQAETDIDWNALTATMPDGTFKDALKTGSTLNEIRYNPEKIIQEKIFDKLFQNKKDEVPVIDTDTTSSNTASSPSEAEMPPEETLITPEDKATDAVNDLLKGLF